MLYIFEDGIIECVDKEIIVLDNMVFSGAVLAEYNDGQEVVWFRRNKEAS